MYIMVGNAPRSGTRGKPGEGLLLQINFVDTRILRPDPKISIRVLTDLMYAIPAQRRSRQTRKKFLKENKLLRQIVQPPKIGPDPQPPFPVLAKSKDHIVRD